MTFPSLGAWNLYKCNVKIQVMICRLRQKPYLKDRSKIHYLKRAVLAVLCRVLVDVANNFTAHDCTSDLARHSTRILSSLFRYFLSLLHTQLDVQHRVFIRPARTTLLI